MHAVEALREDHQRIEELIEGLAGGHGADQKLFERLEGELSVHTLAEDNIFLPQVEDAVEDSRRTTAGLLDQDSGVLGEADGLISAAYENHRELRALLEEAGRLGARGWTDRGDEIRRLVAVQVETEEQLFPIARRVLEDEDFERIGDLIEHCKWQVRGLAQAKLASSSSFRPPEKAPILVED